MSNFFHFDLGFYAGSSKSAYSGRALKVDNNEEANKETTQSDQQIKPNQQQNFRKTWLA